MSNFMSYEDAQTVLTEYAEAIKAEKEFTGTQAEWNSLTEAEKKSYVTAGITDDTPVSELLTNEYARLDIYSESERMIGQWIDGKPLYQKTITDTFTETITDGTPSTHSIDISSLNIDEIITVECESKMQSGFHNVPTIYVANGTAYYMRYYTHMSNDTFNIEANRSSMTGAELKITIKYTKTTDSAVSIGNDTDYSTTEKIVGTWIDGSPVYQKTVSGTMPNSTDTVTIEHGISNFGVLVELSAVAYNESTGAKSILPIVGDAYNDGYTKQSIITVQDTALYLRNYGIDKSSMTAYITLRYTKTS